MIPERLALILLLAGVSLDCARPSPESTVRDFLAATNAHDIETAVGLLDEEFEFRDPTGSFSVRRDAFEPLLEWDVAVGRRATADLKSVRGDTVSVSFEETSTFLEILGIGPVPQRADFVIRERAIRTIVLYPNPEFLSRLETALVPVLQWADPQRLDPLLRNGSFAYDGQRGRLWLELLREARAAGVLEPAANP